MVLTNRLTNFYTFIFFSLYIQLFCFRPFLLPKGSLLSLETGSEVLVLSILGHPGADSGAEDDVKTGGKKFDEQKYERKIGAGLLNP